MIYGYTTMNPLVTMQPGATPETSLMADLPTEVQEADLNWNFNIKPGKDKWQSKGVLQ